MRRTETGRGEDRQTKLNKQTRGNKQMREKQMERECMWNIKDVHI